MNANRSDFIKECIYDLPNAQDPEEVIESLLKLDPEFVSENERILMGQYPNTYTFTKSMAERAI